MKNKMLKFRIWSEKDNTLYYPEKFSGVFTININGDILVFNSCSREFEYANEKDYVIQQFTGLKDKNGKDIYEGDVVKYNKDFNFGDIVNFENGCFFIGDLTINELIHRCWNDFEIISNIHENPELLAKCKNS